MKDKWLSKVNWSEDGLVSVVAQGCRYRAGADGGVDEREALKLTCKKNEAVYWSRSRKKLWRKG